MGEEGLIVLVWVGRIGGDVAVEFAFLGLGGGHGGVSGAWWRSGVRMRDVRREGGQTLYGGILGPVGVFCGCVGVVFAQVEDGCCVVFVVLTICVPVGIVVVG